MRDYDLIVLGGGTGNLVASAAAESGLDVALVERGRLGGTCLNRGCNPSKKLIHRADVAETVRRADSIGVDASLDGIAFADIVDEVIAGVESEAEQKTERAREADNLTLYQAEGRFVGEHEVAIGGGDGDGEGDGGTQEGERLTAEKIVLAGGSRPLIPDSIDGTDEVEFLTSAEALRLDERPDRLVIVGGGYVAVEMAHFFDAMGAAVTIVGHGDVLVDREDRDVAERLTDAYAEKHDLRLGYEATALEADGEETVVAAESEGGPAGGTSGISSDEYGESDGDEIEVRGDEVLVATGRRPNSDRWNVSAAGIETDEKGFVETDDALRTSVEGVWAIGDIAGNYMFKHAADKEAEYVAEDVLADTRTEVRYPGMAHAVFGSPQVASLGDPEGDIDDDTDYETGTCAYEETALGSALRNEGGFAKVIVDSEGEVLGCHVVGPHASMLVHEVSTAVAAGADAETIAETIHVHPALSEVVQGAFRDVCDVAPSGV